MNKTKSPATSGEVIKIGAIYGFTGSASFWAEYAKNATDMAIEEINQEGGVNGRPIQIIYEDSKSNPANSVSAFKKVVEVDGVDVVIGDVWAFLANPLIPLADQSKIVTISPTVMDASVEGKSDYFFTLGHSMQSVKEAVRTFLRKYPNASRVAIICGKDPWGAAYTKMYEDVVKEEGRTIVEKNCVLNFDPTYNYLTESTKTKNAKPDVILVNGIAYSVVKSLKSMGVNVPIVADSNLVDGFENIGAISLAQLDNVYAIDWRANKEFLEKYKDKFGKYPVLEAQNSYEVIRSIAKAVENNPSDILSGFKEVKYESVDGTIDFTEGTNINPNKADAKLYKILGKGSYEEIK